MATTGPTENGTVEAQNPESDTSPIAAQPAEPETNPSTGDATTVKESADKKWPGWPGDCVFRLIVPVLKVGSIIGKKGDLIKKLCEETRARVRVLDGPVGSPDRIVTIRSSFTVFVICYIRNTNPGLGGDGLTRQAEYKSI